MSDITVAVLIGHDLQLLRWCIENARARAGIEHNWLVVNWISNKLEAAEKIEKWCAEEKIKYVYYKSELKPENNTAWFLKWLYRGWNVFYEEAQTKWVVRMGSDQFFSRDWLKNLMAATEITGERAIYHTWTVESLIAKRSRHEIRNFGSTWNTFDLARFNAYANDIITRYHAYAVLDREGCGLYYHHPFRGTQLRPDGCTWLQTRTLWQEFGPIEDHINHEGVTGDVAYMDRLYDAEVPGYLVPKSLTYHLVRGESRSIQA